jgi:hypothetical protein
VVAGREESCPAAVTAREVTAEDEDLGQKTAPFVR